MRTTTMRASGRDEVKTSGWIKPRPCLDLVALATEGSVELVHG
jgi:hypothetical protein